MSEKNFSANQKLTARLTIIGLIINFLMFLANLRFLYITKNQQTIIKQDIDNLKSKFAEIKTLKSDAADIKSLQVNNFVAKCPPGTGTTTLETVKLETGEVGTIFGCTPNN